MSVLQKLNASIELAIKAGTLDDVKHGPVIEAARKVAGVMDEPDWPMVNGKIDNVSPSVFLKYCDKLGIVPDVVEKPKEKRSDLKIVGNSKWKKQA